MISISYGQISKRWVRDEVIVANFLILCCRPTLLDLWCGYGQRGSLIHRKVLAWKRMCHNWFFGRKALRQLYSPSHHRWASIHWIWADAYCAKIINQSDRIILSSYIWFSISGARFYWYISLNRDCQRQSNLSGMHDHMTVKACYLELSCRDGILKFNVTLCGTLTLHLGSLVFQQIF